MREVSASTTGRGDVKSKGGSALWAVPVKVEAAAPLPYSQVCLGSHVQPSCAGGLNSRN